MSTLLSSQPAITPESAGFKLNEITQAVRGMYSKEVNKLAFGVKEVKNSEVRDVIVTSLESFYAVRLDTNQAMFPKAANNERFAMSA